MAVHIPSPEEIKRWNDAYEVEKRTIAAATGTDKTVKEMQAIVTQLQRGVSQLQRKTPKDLRDALNLLFEKHDFSPAEELVEMVLETDSTGQYVLSPDQRIRILSDLQSYVMPKLKSVEVSGEVEHKHSIVIVRYGDDGRTSREVLEPPKQRDAIDVVATPVVPGEVQGG